MKHASDGRSVLMVGLHFPPSAISTGHLRTLGFARHLPQFGWNPIILSARPLAYEAVDPAGFDAIPPSLHVKRTLAFDAKRHFGVGGRYPAFLARPDRWISWYPTAVLAGLRLIRRHRVAAIWSTYPHMTPHCVAHTLSRITGTPWVADFRDPVPVSVTSKDRGTIDMQMRWERRVFEHAACSVFTTRKAMQSCAERYPSILHDGRMQVIPNGFDEEDFQDLPVPDARHGRGAVHLIHSGALYPDGRDPTTLFEALARLKGSGVLSASDLRMTLRASGAEARYAGALERLGIGDIVAFEPPLPYRAALEEQATADALLLFQGAAFDQQIPAKLYEYLRVGRPIFALAGTVGETANLLSKFSHAKTVPLDSIESIMTQLPPFLDAVRNGTFAGPPLPEISSFSRRHAAYQLARLLGRISGMPENHA